MNIEKADIEKAFLSVQNCLEVVHFTDSNRRGVGRRHIGFRPVVAGMKAIGFDKTTSSKCPAPGPHPFRVDTGDTTPQTKNAQELLVKLKKCSLRACGSSTTCSRARKFN